jgi:hypothetical protein
MPAEQPIQHEVELTPVGPWPKVLTVIRRLWPWVFILLPVVCLFMLMREHLVNIPYLDDFMFLPMFDKAAHGFEFTMAKSQEHLTIHDFFMVQMEHRMAFVRGIIMLRHWFSPQDITPENWFTFALLVLTCINVGLLLRKTAGAPFRVWWPVLAISVALFCSPIHYQIVLWAMMFQVVMPAFCLISCLVALNSERLPLWAKWLVGVTAALCATLSFAAGILVWLLPLPVMIWGRGVGTARSRWVFLGCWLAAFAITMGLYFHDLHNEVEGAFAYKQGEVDTMDHNMGAFFQDPAKSAVFVLSAVGGHLGRGIQIAIPTLAFTVGLVSVLLLAASAWLLLARFRDESFRSRLLPWICFGSYTPAAALLVAMGRIWATATGDNSVSPRYTIHGVPLTVSLIAIGFIVLQDYAGRSPDWRMRAAKWSAGALTALVLIVGVSWAHGMRMMETWESARLRVATNTLFFGQEDLSTDGDVVPNRYRARLMDGLGLLGRKMTMSKDLAQFKTSRAPLRASTARWESLLVSAAGDVCEATGYACLRNRIRPADGIFLTYKDKRNGDKWIIFHIAQVEAMPLFLGQTLGRDMQNIQLPGTFMEGTPVCGFKAIFPLTRLPKETDLEVCAWAFDYKEQTTYEMVGRFQIDVVNKVVRQLDADDAGPKKKKK